MLITPKVTCCRMTARYIILGLAEIIYFTLTSAQKDNGVAGCYVAPSAANNAGTSFNSNGGGVYIMEWTSVAIRVWFFPRNSIPSSVTSGQPDPATFGLPDANFEGNCNIDKHFVRPPSLSYLFRRN